MKAAYLALPALALMFAGCTYKYDTDYPMGLPTDRKAARKIPPRCAPRITVRHLVMTRMAASSVNMATPAWPVPRTV